MTLAEAHQCIDEQLADRAMSTTFMRQADDLRCRAADFESRVKPLSAGPRTDDERMWLEKAAALRAEADQMEANGGAEQ